MRGLKGLRKSSADPNTSSIITLDMIETFFALFSVIFLLGSELLGLIFLFHDKVTSPSFDFIYYFFFLLISITTLLLFAKSEIRSIIIGFVLFFAIFLGNKLITLASLSYDKSLFFSTRFFHDFFIVILIDALVAFFLIIFLAVYFRKSGKRLVRLATNSKIKFIILIYIIVSALFSAGFGLETSFLHFFIKERVMTDLCFDSFYKFLMILLIAFPIVIPVLITFLRAHERNFTPLTRSSIEISSGFLLSVFLALILVPLISPFLMAQQNSDGFVESFISNFKGYGMEVTLIIIFLLLFTFPALNYMDKRQRLPYTSFLQIHFTTLVMARGLPAVIFTQRIGDILVYIFSLLLLFPLILTLLWLLISDLRLKFSGIKRVSDRGFLEIVDELRRKAGIKKQVEVYSAPAVSGFARVLGIRKPVLVVSENALKLGSRIKPVIMHELIHLRNLDIMAHEVSRAAFTSTVLCSAASLSLLLLFPYPKAEVNEILLSLWSLLLLPNALLILAVEKWCYRLREVHADILVQESGMDIGVFLKSMFPRKRRRGILTFKSESYERLKYLKEPYRAFIPSYSEGFVFAIVFIHGLILTVIYYALLSLLPSRSILETSIFGIYFSLFLAMMLVFYFLSKMQLRELDEQLSKAGVKSTPRFVISNSRRPVAGFLAGFMLLFISAELVNLVSYILR